MDNYKSLKINDVYVFYVSSGYINCDTSTEMTAADITGVETQSELDGLDEDYVKQCFEEE